MRDDRQKTRIVLIIIEYEYFTHRIEETVTFVCHYWWTKRLSVTNAIAIRNASVKKDATDDTLASQKWGSVKTRKKASSLAWLRVFTEPYFSLKEWGVRGCWCWRHLLLNVDRRTFLFIFDHSQGKKPKVTSYGLHHAVVVSFPLFSFSLISDCWTTGRSRSQRGAQNAPACMSAEKTERPKTKEKKTVSS